MGERFRTARVLLLVFACVLSGCTPNAVSPTGPPSTATLAPVATSTRTEAPTTLAPTVTSAPLPSPMPLASSTPTALPSPLPHTLGELKAPLVVDSARGRLYLTGLVDGQEQILALAASDGQLLAAYPFTGTFAVDGDQGWLYVDQGASGMAVLDLSSGQVQARATLPPGGLWHDPAPVADLATGTVLAFRNQQALVVEPQTGKVLDTITFDVVADPGSCGTQGTALPIQSAVFDPSRRLLHLEFVTYVCTPWTGYTLLSYDLTTRQEIGRRGSAGPTARALAYDGYLYGSGWYRMGFGYRWAVAWPESPTAGQSRVIASSSEWQGGLVGWVLDFRRQRLYEPAGEYLRCFDAATMALLWVAPSPQPGRLVGYDSGTDQLYFLAEGQLSRYPAAQVQPPLPLPLAVTVPPTTPLRSLIVSPGWPKDRTLFGLWEEPMPASECWVFGQRQGRLLISTDGGDTWKRPTSLDHCCGYVSALAVSTQYPQDHTLWAGLPGLGLWSSSDGGQSWRPVQGHLPSVGIQQIQLSPAFVQDQTAFVRTVYSADLYRTIDGGANWESLQHNQLRLVDLSKEYGQDDTLMGLAWEVSRDPQAPPNELLLSTDRGEHWSHAGELGASRTAALLSLAPLFARWQVVFVHGDDGWLYRSENGGAHWVPVLHTQLPEPDPFNSSPRLVYGPETEGQRTLFLLVTQTEYTGEDPVQRGQLYRSPDGGQSWQEMAPPEGLVPSALAISPAFQEDGLLFLGTADGRVVRWAVR